MAADNKLDYDKEIADMEQLIGVLKDLLMTKDGLAINYKMQANEITARFSSPDIVDYPDRANNNDYLIFVQYLELIEKSATKKIDAFQLRAEIELKENVLGELVKRAEEATKQTELTAKQADIGLEERIKQAKELAANNKVPKDLREKLTSRFIDPYRKRWKFGFANDEEKAGFFKALIQLIEAAQHWTIPKK